MRYILKISYDGKNYSGYQIQKDKDTIQARVENSLSQVLGQYISIVASGRTDAGVSALIQICHFDVEDKINERRTIGYANAILPSDIRVLDICETTDDFHARYSAKRKTYEYYFYIGMENPIYEQFATHVGLNINIEEMKIACKYLIGEHDFSAFCASNTDIKDKVRIIYNIDITEVNDNLYKLIICGNGFLYNMVRIVMGTLVSVGQNKINIDEVSNIISSGDRSLAGKTMPSKGLILKNVVY